MTKLGRNDPCSCGSGKKYKKCCLAANEVVESHYRRLRQTESDLIPRLLEHALETLGHQSIQEAWDEFNYNDYEEEDLESDDDEFYDEFDPTSPLNTIFLPWFLYHRKTFELSDDGGSIPEDLTVAESFMRVHKRSLTMEQVILLSAAIQCRFTFCEVREIKPGVGMKLFDLLRRLEFEVIEHTASQSLKRGEILYCAPGRIAEVTSNLSTGPYPLRPTVKNEVLDLREWILADCEADEITGEHLADYETDIRDLYLDWVDRMFDPNPALTNTDGHWLLPQKVCYDIQSADQAFHALKDLAEGVEESELLADAQIEEGRVVSVEIPWLGGNAQAKKRLAGPVLLGQIKIDERDMIIEVNSSERAELIQAIIKERLGDEVIYTTTLVEPLEPFDSLEDQLAAVAAAAKESNERILSLLDDPPPELLAKWERMNQQHWEAWFDEPIPALNHMTPREASQTDEGRELLESLLLEYEQRDSAAPLNIFKPDIPALRRELGLK
jgi:hypothetical protein